ncbi:MAG TPA: YicC/YloC family endoribonuclease [Gemmatimonadales bacterium]|nr:YicC/YloC family endoribonuclease [Gemmatimonadales bacterium]
MAYSMTGFGSADGPAGGGRLRAEIRTVNHRHFNLSLKLPRELVSLESELREYLRAHFDRGHIAVSLGWTEAPSHGAGGFTVNVERARALANALSDLQRALGVPGTVDLSMIVRQPEVVTAEAEDAGAVAWTEVEPIIAAAAAECRGMRRKEGEALTVELRHRLDRMEAAARAVEARAPERLVRERDRLRRSVADLLDGRPLDEQRVAQEIALLADKLDITEELVRFRTHVAACRAALAGREPVGKQLGFLAQELGREVNTMGSKGNDAEILQQVVMMKGELEKFREQLENLE